MEHLLRVLCPCVYHAIAPQVQALDVWGNVTAPCRRLGFGVQVDCAWIDPDSSVVQVDARCVAGTNPLSASALWARGQPGQHCVGAFRRSNTGLVHTSHGNL
jgi:hypothetical protein